MIDEALQCTATTTKDNAIFATAASQGTDRCTDGNDHCMA